MSTGAGMEIVVLAEAQAVARRAAQEIAALVRERPRAVLALPTGSTPIPTYTELGRLHREAGLDLSQVRVFNLDEYLGLGPAHPQSYAAFMRRHFYSQVNIPPERRHIPRGDAPDPPAECRRYEEAIRAVGGLDLAVLGIGVNGHLGFNEPGPSLTGDTHVARLSEQTLRRNFGLPAEGPVPPEVPRQAYTMGIGTILRARRVLLLATGPAKAPAVAQMVQGPVTTWVPASLLQLHPAALVLLDEGAAAALRS